MAKKESNSSKVTFSARNKEQKDLLKTISENDITFVKGFPGSGKTFITVGYGLQALLRQDYDQLVVTRPVVEAGGEKLGFLPGNIYEKIDPYMLPIFDTLGKLLPHGALANLLPKNGNGAGGTISNAPIRILPLAYMRGLTFENSFIICDEAQNATPEQIRMLLTRLGVGSKMVLCGDVYQTDIHKTNGLFDAFELLQDIAGVSFVTLTQESVFRNPIIKDVEQRYLNRTCKKNV